MNLSKNIGSKEFNISEAYLEKEFYIHSVNNKTEKISWTKISHLSKHYANGGIVKIKTSSNKKIITTLSHSHLKKTINGIEPIRGNELKIGDRIPVSKKIYLDKKYNILTFDNFDFELTEDLGWLYGIYLANGILHNNNIIIKNINKKYENNIIKIANKYNSEYKIEEYNYNTNIDISFNNIIIVNHIKKYYKDEKLNKHLPMYIHKTNLKFIKGLLKGYFNENSSINLNKGCILVSSLSKELIEDIQLLLKYFGIFSNLNK